MSLYCVLTRISNTISKCFTGFTHCGCSWKLPMPLQKDIAIANQGYQSKALTGSWPAFHLYLHSMFVTSYINGINMIKVIIHWLREDVMKKDVDRNIILIKMFKDSTKYLFHRTKRIWTIMRAIVLWTFALIISCINLSYLGPSSEKKWCGRILS